MTKHITVIIRTLNIPLNFSGSFMDLCKLRITAFPSKLKTATPKNKGILYGIIALRSLKAFGFSYIFEIL